MMQLQRVRISNFRGLENVILSLDPQLTVLVGENGAGKTTALDALAILLSHYVARLTKSASSASRISEADMRIGASEARLGLSAEDESDGEPISWSIVKQGQRERLLRPLSSELTGLGKFIRRIAARQTEGDDYLHGETAVIYYDQRRAILEIPQRKRAQIGHSPALAFGEGLERGGIDFRKLTYWFQERETDELRRQKADKTYIDPQLDAVRRAMTGATGFRDPYYRIERPRGLTVRKRGIELHARQLSAGELAFMALAGDLARRLAILNRYADDPLTGRAIVLIDEVELHLHPRWQRKMLPWLLETFPACQFIVTTHSPQVLGEIRAKHIRVLRLNQEGRLEVSVPRATYGRDSNFLLLDVLGADERRDKSKQQLMKIDRAIASGDLQRARRAVQRLREVVEGPAPEVTVAEARLARRERIPQT